MVHKNCLFHGIFTWEKNLLVVTRQNVKFMLDIWMYVYQCAFRVSYLWIKHVCILLYACVFNKEMFHIFLAFVVIIICLSCMLFWSTWSAIFLGIFTIVKWIFLCTTVRVLRYNISLRMKYIHNLCETI